VALDLNKPGWSIKRYILVATICLLIIWNYWIPTFLYASTVSFYGSGGPDFNTFYLAGESWLSHKNPYLNIAPSPFVYPPTSLPFYGMFALFQIDFASWLWMVTYFIVFAVALLALACTLDGERRSLYVTIALLLFFTS